MPISPSQRERGWLQQPLLRLWLYATPVPPVIDLNVRKSSSANGGPVVAGDTITYTMVITSSNAITQTGLSISDTLPAGTSYVPNSLRITGYYTFTARMIFRQERFIQAALVGAATGSGKMMMKPPKRHGKIFAFLSCPNLNSNCLVFEGSPSIANTIRRDVDLSNSITATFSVIGVGNPTVRTVTLAMADSTGGVVQQTRATHQLLRKTVSVGIPSQFYISTARLRATGSAGVVSYNP